MCMHLHSHIAPWLHYLHYIIYLPQSPVSFVNDWGLNCNLAVPVVYMCLQETLLYKRYYYVILHLENITLQEDSAPKKIPHKKMHHTA